MERDRRAGAAEGLLKIDEAAIVPGRAGHAGAEGTLFVQKPKGRLTREIRAGTGRRARDLHHRLQGEDEREHDRPEGWRHRDQKLNAADNVTLTKRAVLVWFFRSVSCPTEIPAFPLMLLVKL